MPARLVRESGGTRRLVGGQPAVDGIGIAHFEQAVARDRMRGGTGGDLQQGSGAFAPVGPPVVIADGDQFGLLVGSENKDPSAHDRLLSTQRCRSCYHYRVKLLRFIKE